MAIINHMEPPAPCHDHGHHNPHDHHYDHPLGYYDEHRAECCDDQLPVFSGVGRGLQGDAYRVTIDDPDTTDETHLHGWIVDSRTGELTSDWVSENINGGELSYQYNLNPFNDPQTFTITFIYRRPGRPEWSWTTPAIPYIWTVDNGGEWESPDSIVGSGVATLFIRKTTETEWTEKLLYPEGTTREDYNAPEAEEAWTVNLTFGIGGDVDVPNIDDLAKILGITKQDIYNIINGDTFELDGGTYINYHDALVGHFHDDLGFDEGYEPGCLKADGGKITEDKPWNTVWGYIKWKSQSMLDHIHQDMGFPDESLEGDGGEETEDKPWNTIKEYIDWIGNKLKSMIDDADLIINQLVNRVNNINTQYIIQGSVVRNVTLSSDKNGAGYYVFPEEDVYFSPSTGQTYDSKTAYGATNPDFNPPSDAKSIYEILRTTSDGTLMSKQSNGYYSTGYGIWADGAQRAVWLMSSGDDVTDVTEDLIWHRCYPPKEDARDGREWIYHNRRSTDERLPGGTVLGLTRYNFVIFVPIFTSTTIDVIEPGEPLLPDVAVTFDLRGDLAEEIELSSESLVVQVEYGSTVSEPETPTATIPDGSDITDVTLLGYYEEGSDTAFDFDTAITSAITLTAKWKTSGEEA